MKLLVAVVILGLSIPVLAQTTSKRTAAKHPAASQSTASQSASQAPSNQPAVSQAAPKKNVPKYNAAAETVYKGTVEDIRDRECPVSGGMGSHVILKLESGEDIEVHLATTEFTKMIEMQLQKGDTIEVTGWKTEFEGVQTIFAREIKHGNDTYVFRTKEGAPAWTY